jgi:sulfoxide reductase heme-binding subunit YedZ
LASINSVLTSRITKAIVFSACLVPGAVLLWRYIHHELGANWIEAAQRFTGDWILRFLIFTLCVTPIRRLPGLSALIRYRRMLGLFAFAYACVHVSLYLKFDKAFDWLEIRDDILMRKFYIWGLVAFVCLIPLALTSTAGWIRRLGGRRWRMLHRLIYASALSGALHYYLQGKYIVMRAVVYAAIVVVLVAYRPVAFVWMKRRRGRVAVRQ